THRVLSVDMPGRGRSEWLADPNDYVFPTYLTVLNALVARSRAETVAWVGTSMGGLLGIIIAAQPQTPVARLAVNDVGPHVSPGRESRRHRRRPHDRARCTGADPRIFRARPDVRDVRRNRQVRAHRFRHVRFAGRREVEATDGLQRSSACRRPLGARLRPWHCGAVSGGGCT